MSDPVLRYVCDDHRHLICLPYSVENLHRMADDLGIKRCWFHSGSRFPHYDIPVRRIDDIRAQCRVVSSRELLSLIKGGLQGLPWPIVGKKSMTHKGVIETTYEFAESFKKNLVIHAKLPAARRDRT